MGDLFGSSETSTTTTEPFSGATKTRFNNFYNDLYGNYKNNTGYTGNFTAGENATQKAAISGLSNMTNNQSLQDYANGKYLDPSTNPYIQSSLNILKNNANDQFKDTASAIDTRFNNRGFYDSSSHASALDRAADTVNENYTNAANELLSNQYNQGVSNMLNAQSNLQNANNSLLNAGNTEYGISDADLQRKYQDYLNQQGFTQQDISNLLNYFNTGKNPSQTTKTESGGLGSIIGSIAGGMASNPAGIFCFIAGTKIATPDGEKDIEDIKVGDKVVSLDEDNRPCLEEVTWVQTPLISPNGYVDIVTDKEIVSTTDTQPFITTAGKVLPKDILGLDIITPDGVATVIEVITDRKKELVYDLSTTGRNIYFANGLAAEGREEC